MTHRLTLVLAVAAVAFAALVSGAAADHGHGRGQLYSFSGPLLTAPGANATSVSLQVETGNKPALRAMIGREPKQTPPVKKAICLKGLYP